MAKEFNLIQIHLSDGPPIKQMRVMPNVAVVSRQVVKQADGITGWKLQVNIENDRWASFYIADSEPEALANPEIPDCTIFLNEIQVIQFVDLCDRGGVDVGSICRTCGDRGLILHIYPRGGNSPPGNMYMGCPDCEQGRHNLAAYDREMNQRYEEMNQRWKDIK